jgi:hypothetical protein
LSIPVGGEHFAIGYGPSWSIAYATFWRSRGRRPQATGGTGFLQELDQLADSSSALSRMFDRQHDDHVLQQTLEQSKSKFAENTWLAFRRIVFDGRKASVTTTEITGFLVAQFLDHTSLDRNESTNV